MKRRFENKLMIILVAVVAGLGIIFFTATLVSHGAPKKQKESTSPVHTTPLTIATQATTQTAPTTGRVTVKEEIATIKKHTQSTTSPTQEKTEKETKATESTEESSSPFATAPTQKNKASYQKQWDAGYLLALDYPDTSYSCPHVELSEENRQLIESICMGEFGAGGFTGAALIAQSIKNGMVYFGTDDVNSVIQKLHYTGRKNPNPSNDVKDAVTYIFDMDKNAVQHRILYKYNPNTNGGPSTFHEQQEYVCTYYSARFFDKP